jgi:hypothetical protein
VQAYSRWGDDTHISKAEVGMNSTGDLVVEHVAKKLKLKGILHVDETQRALEGGSSKSRQVQMIMVVCVKAVSVYVTCVTLHKISNSHYQTITSLISMSCLT